MKHEIDIPRPLCIVPHKVLISWGPFLLCVTRQHALQANAHAFNVVNRTPALAVEEIEAYDSVRVDVRMPWDWVSVVFNEDYFGSL